MDRMRERGLGTSTGWSCCARAHGSSRTTRAGNYIVQAPIGRQVALKVLHIDRADPPCISRSYREALIGARLSHPNTVRVLDVGQADSGAIFLAMELLSGQTWEARLHDLEACGATMQAHEAVAIAAEVLRGLAEAHDQGVVHRDLKPSNVMLAEAGGEPFVKIMDFGVAHVLLSGLTEDGRAIGTPAYMSPEQCSGAKLDGRSDLYAVGLALYRCLAGRLPFVDSSALGLMYAHTNLPPADIAALAKEPQPAGLATVVMRALAKDPAERFADARAMRQALEAVLDGRAMDEARPKARPARVDGDNDGTPASSDVLPPASVAHSTRIRRRYLVVAALGLVATALVAFAAASGGEPAAPVAAVRSAVAIAPPVASPVARAPTQAPVAVVAASVQPAAPPPMAPPSLESHKLQKARAAHHRRSRPPTGPVLPP